MLTEGRGKLKELWLCYALMLPFLNPTWLPTSHIMGGLRMAWGHVSGGSEKGWPGPEETVLPLQAGVTLTRATGVQIPRSTMCDCVCMCVGGGQCNHCDEDIEDIEDSNRVRNCRKAIERD